MRPDLIALHTVIYRATDLISISHLVTHLIDYLVDHLVSFKTNSVCVEGFFIYGMCRMYLYSTLQPSIYNVSVSTFQYLPYFNIQIHIYLDLYPKQRLS